LNVAATAGADPASPSGICGGDPAHWFTLWANGKPILEREDYSTCEGYPLVSVPIEHGVLRICRKKPDPREGPLEGTACETRTLN
jgi:hypothetical protein